MGSTGKWARSCLYPGNRRQLLWSQDFWIRTQLQGMPARCDGAWLLRSESTLQKGLCNFSAFLWKKPVLERMKTWGILNKLKHTEVLALVSVLCCMARSGQPLDVCMTSWFSVLLLLNVMCTCEHKCSVLCLLKIIRLVQMSGRHSSSLLFLLWLWLQSGEQMLRWLVVSKLIDDSNIYSFWSQCICIPWYTSVSGLH